MDMETSKHIGPITMPRPHFTPLVEALPATVPFVGPEALERRSGTAIRARLGANENNFGPAPSVIAAIANAAPDVWKYCDSESHELRGALAENLALMPEQILVGEGIDGLLGLTCRLFLAQGDKAVTSLGAYPTFSYHVAGFGGHLVPVPYKDDREDLRGLMAAVKKHRPKIVYLSNPDNPMGTWWHANAIVDFAKNMPDETVIILDEAYCETAPSDAVPPLGFALPNLLRYRTFSKVYGLAGQRIGYVFGESDVIAGFDRIRNHFGVNKIAQIAALAALKDRDYLGKVIDWTAAGRAEIARFTNELGLSPLPSGTNFVTVDCGRDAAYAQAILNGLAERGVFIRKPMAPGLDRCIRISVGTEKDLEIARAALADTLKALN